MPELPEVETTRRGLLPHVLGRRVQGVLVREPRLRWPVPDALPQLLTGQPVLDLRRRAKYLLFRTPAGTLIGHLGMSGSLRIVVAGTAPGPHDHLDLLFDDGRVLRYTDPRRFGSFHWVDDDPLQHPLLAALGPEPLDDVFDGAHLHRLARGRRVAVKPFLMDNHVVVGVGNIYASEALFAVGIHPARAAGRVGRGRYDALAAAVKDTLAAAIRAGGTTLRDFVGGDGKPGYFRHDLKVYGRDGQACVACGRTLRTLRLGQRASVYCPACQR